MLLRQILNVLKQSVIAKKPPPSDDWNGLWDVYDQEAEEFDKSFVEKYASDLDNGLIFVCFLFIYNASPFVDRTYLSGGSFFRRQCHFCRDDAPKPEPCSKRHDKCLINDDIL